MYTNIQLSRGWQGKFGCIAADVEPIGIDYFNEQMSEFREFMGEAEIEEIDLWWRSLCFQYESLESDPHGTPIQDRFSALQDEWSLRRRLMTMTDSGNPDLASIIAQNHFRQSPLNFTSSPVRDISNSDDAEDDDDWDMNYTPSWFD